MINILAWLQYYSGEQTVLFIVIFSQNKPNQIMPTTIKAALKKWEEASGKKSSEAKEIKLIGVYPPIEKMEGPLHILVNCEKLSLSTNLIVNIQNLQVLKNLKVLSLGRNLIKSLQGIEGAGETLEQLWLSYNQIDKLKPIRNMTKLHTLYMAHNLVRTTPFRKTCRSFLIMFT